MTNWFLRARHWQLFILILVAPIVIEIIAIISVVVTQEPALAFFFGFVMVALVLGTQFGWLYNVGMALGKKLPENAGMNVRRFRNLVLVPPIYFAIILLIFGTFAFLIAGGERPSPAWLAGLIIIIPMHFFSIFCIFYSFWFIAKSLKMIERWNHVEFGDYAGDFFLIWFYFVGIWFIQPRINRLFDPSLPPQVPPQQYSPFQQPYWGGQFTNQYPGQYPNQYPGQQYGQHPDQHPPQ